MSEWERCKPWIESALEDVRDCYSIEDIEAGIREDRYQFWPGERSAAITSVNEYPRARFLNVFLAGGELAELKAMVPSFVEWARFLGCTKVTLFGRAGWERALKDQGWAKSLVCLSLPITAPE